jgi:UDP-glucose 4-epimerase
VRVLVTGGRGFIGRYVTEELEARNHQPVILDRTRGAGEAYVTLGDMRDRGAVWQAVAHVEGVIHLAGVLGTQETIDEPHVSAETNVMGALNLFQACRHLGVPAVNIGVGNYWMCNTYAITKHAAERLAEMYRVEHGARITTVRAVNAYGPRQEPAVPFGSSKVRKVVPAFVARALGGHPIEVYGDGTQVMDMIYASDVAHVLVRALEHTAEFGGVEHVIEAGLGRHTTVLQLAETVRDAVVEAGGPKAEIVHLPMRPGEPEHAVVLADPSTLGCLDVQAEEFIPLDAGIRQTVAWFLGHPR